MISVASDDIRVDEISGDAGDEDVADLLVENQLRSSPAVDAPDDGCERRLPGRGRANLRDEIAVDAAAGDEAGISILELLQRPCGIERRLAIFGEYGAQRVIRVCGRGKHCAGGQEETAAGGHESPRRWMGGIMNLSGQFTIFS